MSSLKRVSSSILDQTFSKNEWKQSLLCFAYSGEGGAVNNQLSKKNVNGLSKPIIFSPIIKMRILKITVSATKPCKLWLSGNKNYL